MTTLLRRTVLVVAITTTLIHGPRVALAQHSDIEFGYEDSAIAVEFGPEGRVFEGDFPTMGTDGQFTSEPGFESDPLEDLGLNANDEIVYNVLDRLLYWNGATISPAPVGTQIRIENRGNGVPDTVVTRSSGLQRGRFLTPFNNRIGAADSTGDFHSDLSWFLEPNPGADVGAYAVKLSLSTSAPGIDDSPAFFVVQNFGLSTTAFENGVAAFAAIIPEPTTYTLLAIAAAALGVSRRRTPQR